MTTTDLTDPIAGIVRGDDDPIGPFDPDNICGATIQTYPGERWRTECLCLREPHPPEWLHISACDGAVDYVWRDIRPDEITAMVLTDEGVVCRECGHEVTTKSEDHYAGCRVLSGR